MSETRFTCYDKDTVTSAPSADPDVFLEPEEERALYRHYGEGYDDGDPDAAAATQSGGAGAEGAADAIAARAMGARDEGARIRPARSSMTTTTR